MFHDQNDLKVDSLYRRGLKGRVKIPEDEQPHTLKGVKSIKKVCDEQKKFTLSEEIERRLEDGIDDLAIR
jgi:hypothetical protein